MKKQVLAVLLAAGMTASLSPAAFADAVEVADSQAAVEVDAPDEEGVVQDTADAAADQEVVEAAGDEQEVAGTEEAVAEVDTTGLYHYSLEEAGRITDIGSYSIRYNALLKEDGENSLFCDVSGNVLSEYPVTNIDNLGWGIYGVSLDTGEETINNTALFSIEDGVLIPVDAAAAFFKFPAYYTDDVCPRYLLAYYGTETTENEDEALFFSTDRMIAIQAQEGDTLYKGVLKVFDLVNRQFVPGLEYEHGTNSAFKQVGDNLLVELDSKMVYAPDGSEVYEPNSYIYANHTYMADSIADRHVILDANGTELFSSKDSISTIDYDSEYFTMRVDDGYQVINASGEPVLEGTYYTVYGEDHNRFRVKKNEEDENAVLVAADGTEICSDEDMGYPDDLGFIGWGDDGDITLITPDGRIYEGLSGYVYQLLLGHDDTDFLVLNTGEFAPLPAEDINSIGKGLFTAYNDSGLYALYDAFTGEELLGFEYDRIQAIGEDYIAVSSGDEAVIYKVNLSA